MPGAIVGMIFPIWVVKSLMKWTLGASKMRAGAATTRICVLLERLKLTLGAVPKTDSLAMSGLAIPKENVNILRK